ncbi:MAG TPA: hypothetical protein PJ982_12750 [Lacipirellulaceae bacterium]|nr:hypothetical protein [Lacipirellulaceae bacterium]
MTLPAESVVDVVFDCLPLRAVGRVDVPLDASDRLRQRLERLQAAMTAFGPERTYFLYNAHCAFRFANSEVEGSCRFEFEGAVRTDAGDRCCAETHLDVWLTGETCGGAPPEVEAWLADRVRRAVAIEFDRFLAAGPLLAPAEPLDAASHLGGLSGLGV